MPLDIPKVYPITDRRISGLSHAEQVRRLAKGGASFVQLREKHAPSGEFYRSAVKAVEVAHSMGVRLIINDRVDIAMAVGADGVHLGQNDLPPTEARKLLGPNAIIGYSTHTPQQVLAALELPVDYIALGPIFPTASKEDPDKVVGLEGLRLVWDLLQGPLVAIGGIDGANLGVTLSAGADSAAMISHLLRDPDLISQKMADALRNV